MQMIIFHYSPTKNEKNKGNRLHKKESTIALEKQRENDVLIEIARKANAFMDEAYKEAMLAYDMGEVPVGAVIVYNDEIIARAHNTRESTHDSTGHAEIEAIRKACKHLGDWRLTNCDIYVTLEPCQMCSGAILQSRIRSLFFSLPDTRHGCAGSVTDLFVPGLFDTSANVFSDIQTEKCRELMNSFFESLRLM